MHKSLPILGTEGINQIKPKHISFNSFFTLGYSHLVLLLLSVEEGKSQFYIGTQAQ